MLSFGQKEWIYQEMPLYLIHLHIQGYLKSMIAQLCVCVLHHMRFFVTQWTVVHQAPSSMGFSRQEYWRGFPFLTPGDLPGPGIEPASPVSPVLQVGFYHLSHQGSPTSLVTSLKISLLWHHFILVPFFHHNSARVTISKNIKYKNDHQTYKYWS